MKCILTLFSALLLASLPVTAAGAKQPNILLIVADDLGWSDVGWHGGFGKTPVMDRLVKTGVELDQHYVQPVCTPTRTALMSGRYPGRFGPHALSPSNLRALPLGTVTLASALKSLGYHTHQSGKWHLGARPAWIPNAYGFDTSYGTLTGAADPWTHKYRKGNPYEDTWHRDGKLFHEEGNATELVAAEAVRRIEAGTLIFHDAFEREEDGNLAKAIGYGWNSATADRVPHLKMADLDGGILKIASASKEAGHAAHIHHEAGFTDGGAVVRFKFPGLNKSESLQLGFVDRETKGVHAGHLCYGILSQSSVTLIDHKTGIMNLENRKRRDDAIARKEKVPADLEALLKTKQITVPWKADTEWHELVLVTEGDEMRLSLDGKLMAKHRCEGFAHPMKRWFSFLVPSTVWIDDVKIWKVR
jgi:hypothetical protein